jgi:hypothetical protein
VSRAADPGLQPQRTELAWRRTSAVTAVNAVLILRMGVTGVDPEALALGVAMGAFSLAFIALGVRRRGQLARHDAGASPAGPMRLAACGVAVCALGAAWLFLR